MDMKILKAENNFRQYVRQWSRECGQRPPPWYEPQVRELWFRDQRPSWWRFSSRPWKWCRYRPCRIPWSMLRSQLRRTLRFLPSLKGCSWQITWSPPCRGNHCCPCRRSSRCRQCTSRWCYQCLTYLCLNILFSRKWTYILCLASWLHCFWNEIVA